MARELKPCGTDAAFQRHRRRGETPCEPCREAHAAKKRRTDEARRSADAGRVREAVTAAAPVEQVDPLAEAMDNLRIIRAVLRDEGTPANTLAALTKRRDELVDRIKGLQEATAPVEVSVIDELTSRRRERRAAATG